MSHPVKIKNALISVYYKDNLEPVILQLQKLGVNIYSTGGTETFIKNLGVDAVWLNPIFSSPNDDNGYDISDYRNIMTDFGNMQDFDELLEKMH